MKTSMETLARWAEQVREWREAGPEFKAALTPGQLGDLLDDLADSRQEVNLLRARVTQLEAAAVATIRTTPAAAVSSCWADRHVWLHLPGQLQPMAGQLCACGAMTWDGVGE